MSLPEKPPEDIQALLQAAQQQLMQASLMDSPRLDAELLLCHALQVSRSYLFTWPDKIPNAERIKKFPPLLQQRLQGHPIAHILGEREFWGLSLTVTQDTLIPRPDTETLVEVTLNLIQQQILPPPIKPLNNTTLLDLGTGSGAIAFALKSELPELTVTAVDQSLKALNVAQQNAKNLQLEVRFLQSDWLSVFKEPQQQFDYIVSNPPYIEERNPHLAQGDVRFEPLSALTSGEDGLDDIRTIAQHAKPHLNPQGWLLIEHGYNQADAVAAIFNQNGFTNIQLKHDLGGNPRVTLGQKV